MVDNLSQWITHGGEYTFWGTYAADEVTFNGSTDAVLANAEESHMAILQGIISLPIVAPGAEALDFPGDNGSVGTMIVKPTGAITASTSASIEDQIFGAIANKKVVNVDGAYDKMAYSNQNKAFRPMCAVVNSPAQSSESASKPAGGWDVTEILYFSADDQSGMNIQSRTPREFLREFVLSERALDIDGSTITSVKYGVTEAFVIRYWSPNPIMLGVYIGDGNADQTFTVPYALAGSTANELQLIEAGTAMTFTTDFTFTAATGIVLFTVAGDPAAGVPVVYRAQLDETALP